MTDAPGHPCPCCGYLTLSDPDPNSYEICPVCLWENDGTQRDDPTFAGGANSVSLEEAQRNFKAFGAVTRAAVANVRPPRPEERRDR